MNSAAITPRILSLALLALISLYGCATSDSKQNAGGTALQTAGSKQVIVVPILILAPPEEGSPGGGGDILPKPNLPAQTTRGGELLPTKL